MIYYLVLSVLLTVPYNCVGHSYNNPILSGILSGAQNVGSDVQAVLHGLAQGIDLNFQGSLNSNRGQHQYGYQKPNNYYPNNGANNKPTPPTETIIVIVEEEPEPQQNNYGQRPQGPQPNYGHDRPHHNHHFNKPNFLDKPGYNYGYNSNNNGQNYYNNNNNNQNRPHQHNGPPVPGYGNTPNGPYNNNNYNQNQNDDGPNHYGDTQPSEQPDQYKPPKQITTEAPKEISTEAPKDKPHYWNDKELTTTTPKDDKPYFVPLNQNEYIYGGDKIEINAPKRETNENNKPASEDDDDDSFPIDVRFKQR